MRVRTFGYFFRESLKSIARNGWMSVASIATVSVSLIILGAFVLVVANTNYIAHTMESDVEIAAFLYVDTPREDARDLADEIASMEGVADVRLVPKEEGLKQLNEQFGEGHDLVSALDGQNPLPDYLVVRAEVPEDVPVIAGKIEGLADIETVNYGQGVVEKLFSLAHWIRVGGIVTIALLAAGTLFLIAITVRVTIFARKREIKIMKYVGATNWFIRWPFFIEGMLLGFTGALVACIALYFSYMVLVDKVSITLSFLPLISDIALLKRILLVVLACGPVVGAMGSILSLRRFLHV